MPSKKPVPKEKKRRIPKGTAGPAVELRVASKEGDLYSVKSLATAHMLDDPDERGFTALLWAAWNGHYAVVDFLLKKGADIEHQDEDGQTALFHAAWYGHHLVVALLLESGADPNKADSDGESPLSAAARSGNYDSVKSLIQRNADPRARDHDGHNAVSRALKKGHQTIAQLIENYARVYSPQGQGAAVDTILTLAGQQHQDFQAQQQQYQQYHRPVGGEASPQYGMPPAAGMQHHYGQHPPPGQFGSPQQQQQPRAVHDAGSFQEAVAPLDSLQRQLQARLAGSPGGGGGGGSEVPEKGSYDTLMVLTGETVRIASRGRLPPPGAAVTFDKAPNVLWSVLAAVKGGGVKLQAVRGHPGIAQQLWGEPGDEAGAGMWSTVPSVVVVQQQQQQQRPPQGYASPQQGGGGHSAAVAQQQYQYYQQHHAHLQKRPHQQQHPGSPPPAGVLNSNQLAFGSAGAREAAMPLQGVPQAGSPRRTRYKPDSPAYRGKNTCTVCGKVKPPLNFCDECNEEMCGACWVREHQNRKRRFHVPHPVIMETGDSDEEED